MTDQQDPRKEQYARVRNAFDELEIEDKAIFLIREAVNTIVEGVEAATRTIFDEFEVLFGGMPPADAETEQAAENGNGAETEAASRPKRRTRAKTQRTTTTPKKTRSKKSTPKPDDGDAS